jgi:tRNA-dihydrouridine synthase 3
MERARPFRGAILLAPLTKGGNLPFRRLVVELGARVTCGEMALARQILRRRGGELALLRRAPEEPYFGAQLAGRIPGELADAARVAVEHGADFVDLNLGCPIDLLCRRGLGAALLRKPTKVAAIVAAMREAIEVPLTVKIRLGYDENKPTYRQVGRAAAEAGADAITLHGRSRNQRYKRAASWEAVAELAADLRIPVIGNGDLLTWRDVAHQWRRSGAASVMIGRGALIKPWIFREIADGKDHLLSTRQRLDLLRRFRQLALQHFGDDERGRRKVCEFLFWHLDFFNRYRPRRSGPFDPDDHPLIQTRSEGVPEIDTPWEGWLYSTDPEDRRRLTDMLMREIDEDPQTTGWWSEHPASAILDGPEGSPARP